MNIKWKFWTVQLPQLLWIIFLNVNPLRQNRYAQKASSFCKLILLISSISSNIKLSNLNGNRSVSCVFSICHNQVSQPQSHIVGNLLIDVLRTISQFTISIELLLFLIPSQLGVYLHRRKLKFFHSCKKSNLSILQPMDLLYRRRKQSIVFFFCCA